MPRLAPVFLLLATLVCALPSPARGADASDVLTSPAAVRRLSPTEADQSRPVRFRGRLLLITSPGNAIVVSDGQEGIYVGLAHPLVGCGLGDELEISGVSGAGDFAPIVRAGKVTRVGPGVLPPPRRSTIAEINAGGYDAAWIELHGIVRSCAPAPPPARARAGGAENAVRVSPPRESWLVTFAQGDDQMAVQINGRVSPRDLVDAEVTLRAVVFNVHNANRQFVRANLQVPDESMIHVAVPPPADPFALPVQPIGELLRFSRTGFTGHRVHVRGVVTGHHEGHSLWVRQGDRGLRIATTQTGKLAPGDEVDVVGFPDHGSYTPSLSEAIFRKVAAGPAPMAQWLRGADDISRYDANLVQIQASLVELRDSPDGLLLVLGWNGNLVPARLLPPADESAKSAWQPGSVLQVQGICLVGQTNFLKPTGLWLAEDLQLMLRSAADVTVLQAAPWLTTRRALQVVIAILVVTLGALIVVALLARRQLAQREEARKLAEVEFAAMLAERNRLAREIHDTLAQDLNAVSMQLELARNADPAGSAAPVLSYLSVAHQIVRKCLAEARESIWNMRSHVLEQTDLAGALESVAQKLATGRDCAIRAQVHGRPRRLAPLIENNLLRIGQEAVSNALKHARPRHIAIELRYDEMSVRLTVRDDGPGFDPATVETSRPHFGLRGMQERVAQMNGTLQMGRDPDGGSRVEVIVAAPSPA